MEEPTINKGEKDWCFTLNNYSDADLEMFRMWAVEANVRLACISKEVGESGTPHLQGRIIFRRMYRLTGLKKLHSRASWGWTKCQQDSLYMIKEGSDVFINEDFRKQGKRSELLMACESAADGLTTREMWVKHPTTMVRYSKGILEYKKQVAEPEEHKSFEMSSFPWPELDAQLFNKSVVLYGPAGIGKTEFARAHFKNPLEVTHVDDLKKFDAIEHDGILFDDCSFLHLHREAQIHLLDMTMTRSIHCRFENGVIPRGTKKIFTYNVMGFNMDDEAISSRANVVELLGPNLRL